MMKGFLVSVKRLWTKNIGSNIIVAVMVFLTCYMISLVFNLVYGFYQEYFYFKDTPLNNSLFFMGREGTFLRDDEYEIQFTAIDTELRDKLLEYGEEKGIIGGVSRLMDYYDDNARCSVWVYDKITASYLKKGIEGDGSWLFEEENTADGCYPVVIYKGLHSVPDEEAAPDLLTGKLPYKSVEMKNDEYNIGDTIDMDISMYLQAMSVDKIMPEKNVQVKGKIVGTVRELKPFMFMTNCQWGTAIDPVGEVFTNSSDINYACIFFPYDEELFKGYEFPFNNFLVYFKDDISEESIQDFYNYAKSLGYSQLGRDIVAASKAEADKAFRNSFFMLYMFMGLTLIAILCVSFLNVKKVRKLFSVYYLNGCSFKKSVGIYFTYFISMYGLSYLLFLAVTAIQSALVPKGSIDLDSSLIFSIDHRVALAALLAGIVVSLVSTAVPFMIMKKKTAIQNLKET